MKLKSYSHYLLVIAKTWPQDPQTHPISYSYKSLMIQIVEQILYFLIMLNILSSFFQM